MFATGLHSRFVIFARKKAKTGNIMDYKSLFIGAFGIMLAAACTGKDGAHADADGHADGPDNADGRILADASPAAGPFDAQRREHGEDHRPGDRVGAHPEGDAQSAERGVRDASAEEHQPPADDVSADDAACDARQDARPKSVIEVAVSDKVVEKLHGAVIISLQIYGFFTKNRTGSRFISQQPYFVSSDLRGPCLGCRRERYRSEDRRRIHRNSYAFYE